MKRFINADSIIVAPERQRKHFDATKLAELGGSIEANGLLQAIVLRLVDGKYTLVAGERRLRAMKDLIALGQSFSYDGEPVPAGLVPHTLLSELDPLAAEEAELEENLQRENLTWQEKAAAVARLTNLRKAQALQAGLPVPSIAAISEEVRGSSEGVNQETTRREIIVAKHLNNPAIKAAKTVDEAFKILRKEETAAKNAELGIQVGRTFSAKLHTLFNEDSTHWLHEAASASYDVILTDPPYGMGADEFGDSGGRAEGAHGYKDDYETFMRCATALAFEGFRVAKTQAHMYCFCDPDRFSQLKALMVEAGWNVFRTPLIWYKRNGSRAPWPEQGPQRKYEFILYAVKGKKPVLKMAGDVLDFSPDTNLGHGAQKPVALFQELLSRSCLPGNAVLDPFCGTGPIFTAANELRCMATGVEIDPASYAIAMTRLDGLVNPKDLLEGL